MEEKTKFCQDCGKKIEAGEVFCQKCGTKVAGKTKLNKNKTNNNSNKNKKMPAWAIVLVVISFLFFLIIIVPDGDNLENTSDENISNENNDSSITENIEEEEPIKRNEVVVPDFSKMKIKSINNWCDKNEIICEIEQEYSKRIQKNKMISQSIEKGATIYEGDYIEIVFSKGKKPSIEYINALIKAQTYSDTMHMSKKGIYDQLTSEYGEGFEKDAAQYAINNVKANWKKNALEKAKTYRDTLHMSKNAIYDQLVSEYGEQFTKKEAKYAIKHLDD